LQNLFRKELALQKVEGKLNAQRAKFEKRSKSQIPEEEALKDFIQQLKAKKTTPEAFFRMCDRSYQRSVENSLFAAKMKEAGLKLSSTQTKRLLLLFDEDLTGSISLEEFQNALEAFGANAEKHDMANTDSKQYRPFEQQALEKYFAVLKKRQVTP